MIAKTDATLSKLFEMLTTLVDVFFAPTPYWTPKGWCRHEYDNWNLWRKYWPEIIAKQKPEDWYPVPNFKALNTLGFKYKQHFVDIPSNDPAFKDYWTMWQLEFEDEITVNIYFDDPSDSESKYPLILFKFPPKLSPKYVVSRVQDIVSMAFFKTTTQD